MKCLFQLFMINIIVDIYYYVFSIIERLAISKTVKVVMIWCVIIDDNQRYFS